MAAPLDLGSRTEESENHAEIQAIADSPVLIVEWSRVACPHANWVSAKVREAW